MIDRTTPPRTSLPTQLSLPTQKLTKLPCGVDLYSIDAATADVVRLSLVFRAGSRMQQAPYVAMTTIAMLAEGSAQTKAAQIAEQFDFYGIYYDTSIDRDTAIITIAAANEFLPQALDLVAQIIGQPTFPQHELQIFKDKKREQMLVENQKPSYIARRNFVGALFGDEHPYGRFAAPEAIDNIEVEWLIDFHRQWINVNNMFAVCSGNVEATAQQLIEQFIGKLPHTDAPRASDQIALPLNTPTTRTIERAQAVQSSLRLGRILPPKGDPDFVPLQLLTTVLGGYFSSRLMQNLREQKGYTYGVYASVVNMEWATYLAIACEVGSEHRQSAIDEIKFEMRRLQGELIGAQELTMAKNTIAGELMRLLDGPFGVADISIENILSSMGEGYVNQFLGQINKITADQLLDVARRYFDPSALTVVTVG